MIGALCTLLLPAFAEPLPTIWFVRARGGEYQITRLQEKREHVVYREPIDVAEVNGPHGAILELWPAPDNRALVFYRFTRNLSPDNPNFDERLITYDERTKMRTTRLVTGQLPDVHSISKERYLWWETNTEFALAQKGHAEVEHVRFTILPGTKGEDKETGLRKFKSFDEYFTFTRQRRGFVFDGSIGEGKAVRLSAMHTVLFGQYRNLTMQLDSKPPINLGSNSTVREIWSDGSKWLIVTTSTLIGPGSPSSPSNTTTGNYKFESRLIELSRGVTVWRSDAYVARIHVAN